MHSDALSDSNYNKIINSKTIKSSEIPLLIKQTPPPSSILFVHSRNADHETSPNTHSGKTCAFDMCKYIWGVTPGKSTVRFLSTAKSLSLRVLGSQTPLLKSWKNPTVCPTRDPRFLFSFLGAFSWWLQHLPTIFWGSYTHNRTVGYTELGHNRMDLERLLGLLVFSEKVKILPSISHQGEGHTTFGRISIYLKHH